MSDVFTLYTGNVLDEIKKIADKSVRCIVTSPPYYGLRDYNTAKWVGGDKDCSHVTGNQVRDTKAPGAIVAGVRPGTDASMCKKCGAKRVDEQIGLEETPEAFVEKLVMVFRECRRVLTDDGTLWLNLGDSYATHAKGNNGNGKINGKTSKFREGNKQSANKIGLKDKDLIGIPWMVAFALRADGWYLRSEIIWAKPNPMPESVTDRPTRSHEQVFLLSKSKNYYYDYQAILEPITDTSVKRLSQNVEGQAGTFRANGGMKKNGPLRAVATKLQSGRTERKLEGTGTAGDGTGSKGHSGYFDADGNPRVHQMEDGVFARNKRTVWNVATKPYAEAHFATYPTELIEPCILAGSEKGDIVLDPFSGSGTTGYVAVMHNRRYIGFDLNPEYNKLARKRILSAKPMLFGVERINA